MSGSFNYGYATDNLISKFSVFFNISCWTNSFFFFFCWTNSKQSVILIFTYPRYYKSAGKKWHFANPSPENPKSKI